MTGAVAPSNNGGPIAAWRALTPTGRLVVAICGFAIFFDAFDLIVYGAVVPDLLADKEWGLSPTGIGAIASWALTGQLCGALIAGTLIHRLGAKRLIVGGVIWFSLGMAASALAPDVESFTVLRFITGLGLGVVMPAASSLTIAYAARGKEKTTYAMMFAGYAVGGFCAAALASILLADTGWRTLFWIGAVVPLAVLVPIAIKWLPSKMPSAPTTAQAPAAAVRELFANGYARVTLLFWAVAFAGLLLVYGLQTWLPELMRSAGYDLGTAVLFLGILNGGAVIMVLVAARIADRTGARPVVIAALLAGAASIALLSTAPATGVTYLLVAIAGFGTIGSQIMVNAFVAERYEPGVRDTALGWTLGIGRLGAIAGPTITGWLLDADVGFKGNFYVFAGVALFGALVAACVPARRAASRSRETTDTPAAALARR